MIISKRLVALCAAAGLALGLSACADDYGYGGLAVGYGNGGYYGDPYYDGYGYGGGYGSSSWYGWYGDYYYPGTGIYVYDSYRRPFRWTDSQRRYWSGQQRYRDRGWNGQGNWNGFDRRGGYDRNRQWQGDRQWQGNRQWQDHRRDGGGSNGYVPGRRDRQGTPVPRPDGQGLIPGADGSRGNWRDLRGGRPGGAAPDGSRSGWRNHTPGEGRGLAPPVARNPGGWQGGRGPGGYSGRRAGTRAQPAD